jgi:thiamine pyrophosphokinase
MRAVIVGGGDVDSGDLSVIMGDELVIAADGGAIPLAAFGCLPTMLVGDLDSVPADMVERLAGEGVVIERHAEDKDASDLELALERAIGEGARSVVIIGAFGGERLDHALAAALLLADPRYRGLDIRARLRESTVRVACPERELDLDGALGDLVSLLPVGGDAGGVTASGLRWPLSGATLRLGRSRGLSNEVVSLPASVKVERGAILVVETRKEGARNE